MPTSPHDMVVTLQQRSARAREAALKRAGEVREQSGVSARPASRWGACVLVGSLAWGGFGERSDVDLVLDGVSGPLAQRSNRRDQATGSRSICFRSAGSRLRSKVAYCKKGSPSMCLIPRSCPADPLDQGARCRHGRARCARARDRRTHASLGDGRRPGAPGAGPAGGHSMVVHGPRNRA